MTTRTRDTRDAGTRPPADLPSDRGPAWTRWPLVMALAWSAAYLGLGIAWLTGAGGNPADPAVDGSSRLSLLGLLGPKAGAAVITALAGFGLLLGLVLARQRPSSHPRLLSRLPVIAAAGLGVLLAVVLPDYRLLAAVGYTPILLVLTVLGRLPDGVNLWPWPVVNMALLSVAGLAWVAAAVVHHRRVNRACVRCGRGMAEGTAAAADADVHLPWTHPRVAARWGRWAVAAAVAVPVGYAVTRYAWALGIPLGVSQRLLDDLGPGVYAGAALATLGVGGAVLTLGLVQRWGEVFPRWLVGLAGRRVPVWLAMVPAAGVSVAVTSAGLMFVRFWVTGQLDALPGEASDVAAWLPEMFWPLWGVALATATYAYWLRRRGVCRSCGLE